MTHDVSIFRAAIFIATLLHHNCNTHLLDRLAQIVQLLDGHLLLLLARLLSLGLFGRGGCIGVIFGGVDNDGLGPGLRRGDVVGHGCPSIEMLPAMRSAAFEAATVVRANAAARYERSRAKGICVAAPRVKFGGRGSAFK